MEPLALPSRNFSEHEEAEYRHHRHQGAQLPTDPDDTSLDDLVPSDNFYRRLEERLGLSFVR